MGRLLDRDARHRRGRQAVVDSVGTMQGHRNRCFNWRMCCSSSCLMPHHSSSPSHPTYEAAKEPQNLVVVFADFDPPTGSDTPMLQLRQGYEILPLGKDDQGWWYGRQQHDGKEGWFPPGYVRPKDEVAAAIH